VLARTSFEQKKNQNAEYGEGRTPSVNDKSPTISSVCDLNLREDQEVDLFEVPRNCTSLPSGKGMFGVYVGAPLELLDTLSITF